MLTFIEHYEYVQFDFKQYDYFQLPTLILPVHTGYTVLFS